jgi:hypothetical protein
MYAPHRIHGKLIMSGFSKSGGKRLVSADIRCLRGSPQRTLVVHRLSPREVSLREIAGLKRRGLRRPANGRVGAVGVTGLGLLRLERRRRCEPRLRRHRHSIRDARRTDPFPPNVGSEKSAQACLDFPPTGFAQGGKPEVHFIGKLSPEVDFCTIERLTTPRAMHRTPPNLAKSPALFVMHERCHSADGYPRDSR